MMKDKKNWLEWAQIAVTGVLVPLMAYAIKWSAEIEDRIGENETSIRLIRQDRGHDSQMGADMMALIRTLADTNGNILQRLVKMETKIDALQKSADDHSRVDHTRIR